MRVLTPYGKTRVQPSGRDDAVTVTTSAAGSPGTSGPVTRRVIDFYGPGAEVTDDPANDRMVVTIPGSGGAGGGTPTATPSANAGTGATAFASGDDMAGLLQLATGTAVVAGTMLVTVTFSAALGSTPKAILITAANDDAAELSGTGQVTVRPDATNVEWYVWGGSVAVADSTTYQWHYKVCL